MPLTEEEKQQRRFDRMFEKAREKGRQYYLPKVTSKFQEMIRAEAGMSRRPYATAVVDGEIREVHRRVGECVCITCGKKLPWSSGIGGMHTGHFISGRYNSIVLEEANVAPQCSRCNVYMSGAPQAYRKWMEHCRPNDIERLENLKRNVIRQFTLEELVELRIEYMDRIKAAVGDCAKPSTSN